MTRATLLHVLDQPTALGPVEVRELEQLALAFPYCQTAHLLLAKAAHDQGTMLAGQRLRRAATYAADRALLRRLIEQADVAPVEKAVDEQPVLLLPAPAAAAEELKPLPPTPAIEAAPLAVVAPAPGEQEPLTEQIVEITPPATERTEPHAPAPPAVEAESAGLLVTEAPAEELPPGSRPEKIAEQEADDLEGAPIAVAEAAPQPTELPFLVDQPDVDIPVSAAPAAAVTAEILPEPEPDLPAQAPAIRPPVEVGEARFEFGLAEPTPPPAPEYELPGLVDEWAASAVTRSLGSPELFAESLALPAGAATPEAVFTPAAFTGDDTIGYAFGESSRLGFSMQLLNRLANEAEPAEAAALIAAQPTATPLPPSGAFFEPDPLLLDHWAMHRPVVPAVPSSLDLINNFLRRQPRLTRPAMLPPSPAAQADLSVRSTRAEPDLASESLARILVRQGKTARAIEIYEKLMVKQPEKMAYFAAQIQQLQPPA